MCLFSAVYRAVPERELLILANREESRRRPTAPPGQRLDHGTAWFGGLDLLAGGTWLGINEHGLVVAVTNRHKLNTEGGIRSRGLLCRDLLGQV
jgi:uncharacterized protein with NRDE domain